MKVHFARKTITAENVEIEFGHPNMPSSIDGPDLTFVCCIEHGRLETQTILMIRSLRTFGGVFANLPIIAVIGRLGAPLNAETTKELDQLKVKVVRSPSSKNPFPWFNYSNKIVAVSLANELSNSALVAWIDSDIIFARPPTALNLTNDEDFVARRDPLLRTLGGPDDIGSGYWKQLCEITGSDYKDLIWLERRAGRRSLLYFNSGVFAWRRSTNFADSYRNAFVRLIKSRIAQKDGSFFSADQVILNSVLVSCKLRWRHMRIKDHHMMFPGLLTGKNAAPSMKDAAIIHYSNSLSPPYRSVFLDRLRCETPELARWILDQEATLPSTITTWKFAILANLLKLWRNLLWRLYARRVIRCED